MTSPAPQTEGRTTRAGIWLAPGPVYTLRAGALEGSNTDIAEEFSKMIVTQQAYSANTRVISTSQQMLQETLNVVR